MRTSKRQLISYLIGMAIGAVALFCTNDRAVADPPTLPTLEQLIERSELIVSGIVSDVDVQTSSEKVGAAEAPVLAHIVSLKPANVLKGPGKGKSTSWMVRQYQPLALGATKGDSVLWFLAHTPTGFDRVLHGHAGYFTIVSDEEQGVSRQWVLSLVHNKGLWGNELWSSTLKQVDVEPILKRIAGERAGAILAEYANKKCQPRGIPLELVQAVIEAKSRQ